MFESRADQPELLDDPSVDPASLAQSYRFMQIVNRRLGGTNAVTDFLMRSTRPGQSVRVLDLGSGACDIPLAVTQKLNASGRCVEFTCLERNPAALALARKNLSRANSPFVTLVEGDVFVYQPQDPFDFATGSLFFHHLSDDQILRLLSRLRAFVTRAIFINDLYRSPVNYLACAMATIAASPISRHDALLSIRRGFTEDDLRTLLEKLEPAKFTLERRWFYRITADVYFQQEPPQ